jgi:hypothetical protein
MSKSSKVVDVRVAGIGTNSLLSGFTHEIKQATVTLDNGSVGTARSDSTSVAIAKATSNAKSGW